jgi:hypothetical protein
MLVAVKTMRLRVITRLVQKIVIAEKQISGCKIDATRLINFCKDDMVYVTKKRNEKTAEKPRRAEYGVIKGKAKNLLSMLPIVIITIHKKQTRRDRADSLRRLSIGSFFVKNVQVIKSAISEHVANVRPKITPMITFVYEGMVRINGKMPIRMQAVYR